MYEITKIISLTIPLLVSGILLILVIKLSLFEILNIPLDREKFINDQRFLGNNKTVRGVTVHIFVAIVICSILFIGYNNGFSRFIHSVFNLNPMIIGLVYSLCYTLGELTNSAIKRQLRIAPGRLSGSKYKNLQYFFDLSDGIILVALALIIFTSVTILEGLLAASIGILFHYLTDIFMKKLGLK